MYDSRLCYVLGRKDLISSARFLPLNQVKMHHILPSSLSTKAKKNAHLIVVKVSCVDKVTLKDVFAHLDYTELMSGNCTPEPA